ncbi:MAG: hypothetical protein ACTHMS_08365 [Jatrophihabitans sp.]|uniref:hypothetical protein n=1 Tax=Jatrophihabitans sp. TaxID=1932789 RepID=UPI003F819F2D
MTAQLDRNVPRIGTASEEVLGTSPDGLSVVEVHRADGGVVFEYRLAGAVLASGSTLHQLAESLRPAS